MARRDGWDADRAIYDFAARRGWYWRADPSPAAGHFGPLPAGFVWAGLPQIRRGFPWCLSITDARGPTDRFEEVVGRCPAEEVLFLRFAPKLDRLAGVWPPKLTGIGFVGGAHGARAIGVFLRNERLAGLEEMHLGVGAVQPDGVVAVLDSPVFANLTAFTLAGHPPRAGVEFLGELLLRGVPARLRSLSLSRAQFGDAGLELLIASPALPQLDRLDLANNHLNAGRAAVLARAGGLVSLKVLTLSANPVGNAGAALFTSPHLTGLKVLDLSYCQVGDEALRTLLDNSPHADGLNFLNLTGSPASAEMKQAVKDRMGDRVRV